VRVLFLHGFKNAQQRSRFAFMRSNRLGDERFESIFRTLLHGHFAWLLSEQKPALQDAGLRPLAAGLETS
jgi:hypothetical protein